MMMSIMVVKSLKSLKNRKHVIMISLFVLLPLFLVSMFCMLRWFRSLSRQKDHFTQRDANSYKTVIAAYQRVLERNPTSKELETNKQRLDNGKTPAELVDMLVSSDEYKRLHGMQSNSFNTDMRGSVTYRQALMKLGKLYKDVFGVPKIPKEHLDFLVEKYMHEYQLDDTKMTKLLMNIRDSDKQRTLMSPSTVSPDPVLDLLNTHLPSNTNDDVMETGLDQQLTQAYLQDIIAQTESLTPKTPKKSTTPKKSKGLGSAIHDAAEGVANKIRVNVGKMKLSSPQGPQSPQGQNSNQRTKETPSQAAKRLIKTQQTLLLDASTAKKAASLLPIPPAPPVCIGRSAVIHPTMQQSSLLGTLLEDVMDSYDTANTNVYKTVKQS